MKLKRGEAMAKTLGRNRKTRSAKQVYAIKKNYVRKASNNDTETILKFVLGIPGADIVLIYLFMATDFLGFLIVAIIVSILGCVGLYRAITRKAKKVNRVFT